MTRKIGAFSLLALLVVSAAVLCTRDALGQSQGQSRTGVVKGVAQYTAGKPLFGVWIIISNDDVGTSYRVDTDPQGKFTFDEVFPGKYVFGFSPAHFQVVSPSQIEVHAGQTVSVTVVVTERAPTPDQIKQ